MNKTTKLVIALATVALAPLASFAQATPKILVVDLAKLFDGHWKTKEETAKLQADQAKAQEQVDQLRKEGNALVDQFKEVEEQSKNPTATADAKAKALAEVQKKYTEIQQKQTELKSFAQNAQNAIHQRAQTFKAQMLDEISKTAVEIAKRKGATFLVDKSGPTMAGVSNVVYSDPAYDITDEVMVEINKDHPATTTAVAPAPATGSSPSITVPGIAPAK